MPGLDLHDAPRNDLQVHNPSNGTAGKHLNGGLNGTNGAPNGASNGVGGAPNKQHNGMSPRDTGIRSDSLEAVIMSANAVPLGAPAAPAKSALKNGARTPTARPESVRLAENLGAVLEELTRSQIGDVEGMVKIIVQKQNEEQYGKIQGLMETLLQQQAQRYEDRIETILEENHRNSEKLAEKQKRQRTEEIADLQRSISSAKKESGGKRLKRFLSGKKKSEY